MGVDHGCRHILMTQQRLHGTNVVAAFQQMGGEAVAHGMATARLVDSAFENAVLAVRR